jgi:DNA-directed RNA polymerase subunit RPC12/RpoP
MLGPYNYVVCKNCQKKQDLQGTACYHCGYRLLVDVADSLEKKSFKAKERQSLMMPGKKN